MIIKPLETVDLDGVTDSFISAFSVDPWDEEWPYDVAYKRLKNAVNSPGFCGLVIKDGDTVVGGAVGLIKPQPEGMVYELSEFFVSGEYQNKGYGEQLYRGLLDYLKSKGIIGMLLVTTKGIPAHSFYHKMGATGMPDTVCMSQEV